MVVNSIEVCILLLSGIFVENCYKMLMSMSIWELLSIILAVLKQLKGGCMLRHWEHTTVYIRTFLIWIVSQLKYF